jgi:hypothetical protein
LLLGLNRHFTNDFLLQVDDETAIHVAYNRTEKAAAHPPLSPVTEDSTQSPVHSHFSRPSVQSRGTQGTTNTAYSSPKNKYLPGEERWVPATVSKAGKALWKGVKIALAVPADDELKSYSFSHPPLGHTVAPVAVPVEEPRGRSALVGVSDGNGGFGLIAGPEYAVSGRGGWGADTDTQAVRVGGDRMSVISRTTGGETVGTTWPMLERDDYSQIG